MSWWGKVLGGAFGSVLGGPLGGLLGAAVGHGFDRGLDGLRQAAGDPAERERVQMAFFTTTFAVMGHLAKTDGRVTPDEIGFAEAVMAHMALGPAQRQAAIKLFREGKAPDFGLDAALAQFRSVARGRTSVLRMFLEIQVQAAYADGGMAPAERRLLAHICQRLGFSPWELDHIDALVRATKRFSGGGPKQPSAPRHAPDRLSEAYAVLGVARAAGDAEIKRAFRKLMNQHHPDKLVAKGVPEEMVRLATEKTREIKDAYDVVRESRGMR